MRESTTPADVADVASEDDADRAAVLAAERVNGADVPGSDVGSDVPAAPYVPAFPAADWHGEPVRLTEVNRDHSGRDFIHRVDVPARHIHPHVRAAALALAQASRAVADADAARLNAAGDYQALLGSIREASRAAVLEGRPAPDESKRLVEYTSLRDARLAAFHGALEAESQRADELLAVHEAARPEWLAYLRAENVRLADELASALNGDGARGVVAVLDDLADLRAAAELATRGKRSDMYTCSSERARTLRRQAGDLVSLLHELRGEDVAPVELAPGEPS